MRKLILLILCVAFIIGGCGLTDSTQQRHRRMLQITNLQSRMLMDDWDYVWLYDRNSWLTEYHPRIGK